MIDSIFLCKIQFRLADSMTFTKSCIFVFSCEELNNKMRLGTAFIQLARRKRVGLETRIGYISPENNAGIWHGAGVKSGFIETFSGKK